MLRDPSRESEGATDPLTVLPPRIVAALLELADLVRMCAVQPRVWNLLAARLPEVGALIKDKHRLGLHLLAEMLQARNAEAMPTEPRDGDLPRAASLRGLVLEGRDVYFRLAAMLPDEGSSRLGRLPLHGTEGCTDVRRVLEGTIRLAMANRLAHLHATMESNQLRSCLDGFRQGVASFTTSGDCLSINSAARELLGPEWKAQCDGGFGEPIGSFVAAFRDHPVPASSSWSDLGTVQLPGGGARVFGLTVPGSGDGSAPSLHLFMIPDDPASLAGLPAGVDLSGREQDVLRAIVSGLSQDDTAANLGISVETVRTYTSRLYLKLQVRTREELLRLVLKPPPVGQRAAHD